MTVVGVVTLVSALVGGVVANRGGVVVNRGGVVACPEPVNTPNIAF